MKPVLEVKDLSQDFGGLRALNELSLTVNSGEIVALIGPNGAGKTTFFNCVTGIYTPTEGQMFLHDAKGEKRAAVDVLKAYRQQSERLRDEELQKAQRMLANGSNPEDVLVQLARGLTNKLLHAPSVQLKKLSAEGRLDALAMAQELFALGEGSSHSSADKK